jgi:hypothetical protein
MERRGEGAKSDFFCGMKRLVFTVGYPIGHPIGYLMVLNKSHGKSAIYMRSPMDFLWIMLDTMGHPMEYPM